MKPLKIFTDLPAYDRANRSYLHDILRPYVNDRSNEERRQMYGERVDFFTLTGDIDEADFCLLPMLWGYYLKTGTTQKAFGFVSRAENAGKLTVVASYGDYYLDIPLERRRVIIFQSSLYRSQRKPNEFSVAPLFPDNLLVSRNGQPNYRLKHEVATVGFCGNATEDPLRTIYFSGKNLLEKVKYGLKLSYFNPHPVIPAAYFRAKVLKEIERGSRVKTNFIMRQQYWAGVKSGSERSNPANPAWVEYVENLDNSDYIVTIRGTGNWSNRFYEALNWGRIPVFINTDCVLPYDFAIDWKQYCIWVEQHEIPYAAEKIADFHASLSNEQFVELQQACRQLWIDRLSGDGFYRHFHEFLNQPSNFSA